MKPLIIENFADNGEFSHYELINPETGETLWTEDEEKELNLNEPQQLELNIPVVSGSKTHRIAQIQKHLENGDIKFTRTPLFEPPKLIIGCDLAAEGTSDYSVTYYH